MPKNAELNVELNVELNIELILRLREKKWSHQALADRFLVSKPIIVRLLKSAEPDKKVITFADKLAALLIEVPNDYCRKELGRTIDHLRTYQSASVHAKCRRVTDAIEAGARALVEIAEDAKLHKEEAEELLDNLIERGTVIKREQGGVHNRGRKMKYHYLLAAELEAA